MHDIFWTVETELVDGGRWFLEETRQRRLAEGFQESLFGQAEGRKRSRKGEHGEVVWVGGTLKYSPKPNTFLVLWLDILRKGEWVNLKEILFSRRFAILSVFPIPTFFRFWIVWVGMCSPNPNTFLVLWSSEYFFPKKCGICNFSFPCNAFVFSPLVGHLFWEKMNEWMLRKFFFRRFPILNVGL